MSGRADHIEGCDHDFQPRDQTGELECVKCGNSTQRVIGLRYRLQRQIYEIVALRGVLKASIMLERVEPSRWWVPKFMAARLRLCSVGALDVDRQLEETERRLRELLKEAMVL